MRWVLTYKSAVVDELGRKIAKARLVILGYQDPDLVELERESPTLNTTSRSLIFTIVANQKWKLKSGDVKTAFMQGDEEKTTDLWRYTWRCPRNDWTTR